MCRGEDVEFMRKLLGEPINAQIKHPIWPSLKGSLMGLTYSLPKTVIVTLGCAGACDFCATSHFFGYRRISILKSAEEIYSVMLRLGGDRFYIYDEDFLCEKKRIMELGKLIRKGGKMISYMCFSTAKSAAQYKPEELVRCGVESVWIGVESRYAKYPKLIGVNIKKIFKSFRECGITTMASAILGLDFHTPGLIEKEIKYILSLNPIYTQFRIYTPTLGTTGWKRLEKENRVLDFSWNEYSGQYLVFKHPHLGKQQIEKMKDYIDIKLFNTLGPSVIRNIGTLFQRYKKFKNSGDIFLSVRAKKIAKDCKHGLPLLLPAELYALNKKIAKKIHKLRLEIIKEFRRPNLLQQIKSSYIILACGLMKIRKKLFGKKIIQPKLYRYKYNW